MKKTEEEIKEKRTSTKSWNMMILITLILAILASGYLIYNILLLGPIEPIIRYIIVGVLIVIDLFCLYKGIQISKKKKKKKKRHLVFITLSALYIIVNGILGMGIQYVYQTLGNMNKDYITYSASLLSMKDYSESKMSSMKDANIGIISKDSTGDAQVIYKISQELIKENKLSEKNDLVTYDDFSSMLNDLYEGKIQAMFVSSSYEVMFKNIDGYQEIKQDTKVLGSKDKKMKKSDTTDDMTTIKPDKAITEPFSILLMGVDSEVDGLDKNGAFNGDALMLITFNPKTLNATMLSIPRDSYVPIACFNGQIENKLTHAAWYGESCMMKTIQNFTGVNIDYYAKINFKGVVSLVDALGGIDVEVPRDLCTDDSNRGQEVCIKKGWQHLDGEGALVLARNRHDMPNGDIDRGLNQQIVLQGMLNSAKKINSIPQITDIFNTISRNMDTNFTIEQILSFYNIGKDILKRTLSKNDSTVVNVQQLFLSGDGQMIYDEGMKMVLWDYVLKEQSVEDVVKEMKVNLELEKHELIKEFAFSINEPYEKAIIGQGPYKGNSLYALLPDFTGDTQAQAQSWATKNGVKVSFETKESTQKSGTIIAQSLPAKKRLDKITTTLVLTVAKNSGGTTTPTKIDCSTEENATNSKCVVPNFTTMTKQQAINWASQFKNITLKWNEVDSYGTAVIGQIVAQDVKYKDYLKNTKTVTLTIVVKPTSGETNPGEDDEVTTQPDE